MTAPLHTPQSAHPLALDLGCGLRKHSGSIGIDRVQLDGVDIVADIERGRLPFQDRAFMQVYAHHAHSALPVFLTCSPTYNESAVLVRLLML